MKNFAAIYNSDTNSYQKNCYKKRAILPAFYYVIWALVSFQLYWSDFCQRRRHLVRCHWNSFVIFQEFRCSTYLNWFLIDASKPLKNHFLLLGTNAGFFHAEIRLGKKPIWGVVPIFIRLFRQNRKPFLKEHSYSHAPAFSQDFLWRMPVIKIDQKSCWSSAFLRRAQKFCVT